MGTTVCGSHACDMGDPSAFELRHVPAKHTLDCNYRLCGLGGSGSDAPTIHAPVMYSTEAEGKQASGNEFFFEDDLFGITDGGVATYFAREVLELEQLAFCPAGPKTHSHKRHAFASSAIYEGQWLGNERHGFGKHTWPDGTTYEGQWENNAAQGRGVFQHSDGSMYI